MKAIGYFEAGALDRADALIDHFDELALALRRIAGT